MPARLSRPMPILLAEDSPVIRTVVRAMLANWGYEVIQAADGHDALRLLESDSAPKLAVLDWMMPGISGPELCRRLRARAAEPYTYILLLTSRAEASDVVEGLDAGADDYLRKPFHPRELRARVRSGARIVELQEQLLEAREALRQRITIDPLTGLANRAAILDTLGRELEAAERSGASLSILLAGIDRFRQINDSFGLQAGDAVLREFGRRLTAAVPAGTSVGRYSCERFLAILPGRTQSDAAAVGRAIRDAIAAEPFSAGAASFPVTCCVGAAGRGMPYSSDPACLLRSADAALLAARDEARERLAVNLRASGAAFSAHS